MLGFCSSGDLARLEKWRAAAGNEIEGERRETFVDTKIEMRLC